MQTSTSKKEFLTKEAPALFKKLEADRIPNFGLMTPQHMVEHLVVVTKTTLSRRGEPEETPSKRQLGFKKFLENGAVFQHRPSDKTKDDLPPLKYESLEEAITKVPEAIERFYKTFEENPDFIVYNPFMGELNFNEMELFHFQHYRYHLWQFGLIEEYN